MKNEIELPIPNSNLIAVAKMGDEGLQLVLLEQTGRGNKWIDSVFEAYHKLGFIVERK